MPSFAKPKFAFDYAADEERKNLRNYRDTKEGRAIPDRTNKNLLVASWNIANLGEQKRRDQDYEVLAEVIGWFDLVAIQEVKENLAGLDAIRSHLPKRYAALYSDAAGNNERLAFLYDRDRVQPGEEIGEIAFPVADYDRIRLPDVKGKFEGFDRTPYFASFIAKRFSFNLASVHLYYGSQSKESDTKSSLYRRILETYAVATWAHDRQKSAYTPVKDIIVLGDFNMPAAEKGDPIFDALTKKGLSIPEHGSKIGSNLAGDMYYDQIAFFPGTASNVTGKVNVFDFDGGVFPKLWQKLDGDQKKFKSYLRYHLSDHRPIWCEFKT